MQASKKTKTLVLINVSILFVVGMSLAVIKRFFPELLQKANKVERKSYYVNDGKIHIVIDAGHGGPDPGAINKKTGDAEKTICAMISSAIVQMADTSKYTILQTRPGDSNIHRHDRMLMAMEFKTNLLLSIHSNSFFQPHLNGFEIAFSDSSLNVNDSLSKPNPNYAINKQISDSLLRNIGYVFPQMKNRGLRIRKDRIWMIYAGNFPSILIEWGYISNPNDLVIMKDPQAHQLLAKAIWFTIDKYFESNPITLN